MASLNISKKLVTTLLFALIGWALCGAIMGIGLATLTIKTTLIIHAIGAPLIFLILTLIYYKYFAYSPPIFLALFFVGFIIAVDFFIVALLINKSLDMFFNPLGTWIPFILIFLSTYSTGTFAVRYGN
jgi:hypothetical protein